MKTTRLGVLLLIPAALASAPARGDETLRWKFTKGEKLTYRMVQKTESRPEPGGAIPATTMAQTIDMTWEVKDVSPAGDATMDQTVDRIAFEMKGPGGDVRFDTSQAEKAEGTAALLEPLFRGMVGSPIGLTMTARGEVKDVKVPAKLVDALKSVPNAAAGGMLSEEGFKSMTTQASLNLPAQPVANGFKWDDAKHVDLPFGRMNMKVSYTYEGPAGADDRIASSVAVEFEPKEGQPFTVKIADQEGKGAFRFDSKAGLLKGSEMKQTLKMEIKAGEQQLVQTVVTTVALELTGPPSTK
ncbi:MAG TPA: DUF6263 family protein [Isosphaeraceae bacterium]|jgi:hypothetical protein|nr:DUF6263 family protein [Isosphaeraceae bacterium]